MKTQGQDAHSEPESSQAEGMKRPASPLNRPSIKKPSPFWPIIIGRRAAVRMIHLTRTGSGQKQNCAAGSLPPRPPESFDENGAETTTMINKTRLAAILILLRLHPAIAAATLKEETKAAWEAYLEGANAAMQARLQPGAHFLWLDDEPGQAEKIRKGFHIAPVGPHIPKKVPSGLIHDWLGVGFIPNVKIEDILRILRDYDRYKGNLSPKRRVIRLNLSRYGRNERPLLHAPGKQIGGSEDGARYRLRSFLFSRGRSALVQYFQYNSHPGSRQVWYSGPTNLARGPGYWPDLAAIQHHTPGGARWGGIRGVGSHRIEPRYSCGVPPSRDAHRAPRIERFPRHISSPNEARCR